MCDEGRYQPHWLMCITSCLPVLSPSACLLCLVSTAGQLLLINLRVAFSILQLSSKLGALAAAVLYIIIRIFKYLLPDFLSIFLLSSESTELYIIQAEILPRSSFVSDRLFGGITSLVQDGIGGGEEKKE